MAEINKRAYVSEMYDTDRWKKRVEDMPNGQIVAIYFRAKAEKEAKLKAAKETAKKTPINDTLF